MIGYLGQKNEHSRWLARCLCGIYEARSGRAVRNPKNTHDCCWQCHRLARLRKSEAWRRTGKDRDISEYMT